MNKTIRSLEDVELISTPTSYFRYEAGAQIETVHEELRASIFSGKRQATVILSNAYGEPFLETRNITSVEIEPRPAGGSSKWQLCLRYLPPRKRKLEGYNRDFPTDMLMIAWGEHKVNLSGLPPLASYSGLRCHCKNHQKFWKEVSRRFHEAAGDSVWLDTTECACDYWASKRYDLTPSERESHGVAA
jgi:hypothetical protein